MGVILFPLTEKLVAVLLLQVSVSSLFVIKGVLLPLGRLFHGLLGPALSFTLTTSDPVFFFPLFDQLDSGLSNFFLAAASYFTICGNRLCSENLS